MIIILNNLYQDADAFTSIVNSLTYEPAQYGEEVEDFQYQPDGLIDVFSNILRIDNIQIADNSGKFRKPYPGIRCEQFWSDTLCNAVIALSTTTVIFWKHIDTGITSINQISQDDVEQFVHNECIDTSKWQVVNSITLSPNDCMIYSPYAWVSFSEECIIQPFQIRPAYTETASSEIEDIVEDNVDAG